jgi:hypothetical protein
MIYFRHVKTLSGRRSKNLSGDVRLYWGWSIFSGENKSGIKDLFRAGMKNWGKRILSGDERIFFGDE